VRVFRAAGPQAGLHLSAIDQPFGEIPSGGNQEGWKIKRPRGQRVLDGLSGVRVRHRAQAAIAASAENGI
jgi:hypothetical protein